MNPNPIRRDRGRPLLWVKAILDASRAAGQRTISGWVLPVGLLLAGFAGGAQAHPPSPLADAALVREAVRHHVESQCLAPVVGFAVIRDGRVDTGLVGPMFDEGAGPLTGRFVASRLGSFLSRLAMEHTRLRRGPRGPGLGCAAGGDVPVRMSASRFVPMRQRALASGSIAGLARLASCEVRVTCSRALVDAGQSVR